MTHEFMANIRLSISGTQNWFKNVLETTASSLIGKNK